MIEWFFTESVTVSRKTRAKVNGVVKETLTEVWSGKVAFDKATTASLFSSAKETFDYSAVVFAPIASGILEDDILTYSGVNYDVRSVVNPLNRDHHLEVGLEKRS